MAEYICTFKEPPKLEGYYRELIRCRDCRYCVDTEKYCVCMYWLSATRLNGFCHEGERKEDEINN